MALLAADGSPAVIGETTGRWLERTDFVFCGDDHQDDDVREIGPHTFPRDWPDVYDESHALRALLRRKGPCAAKRVSVVPDPEEEHLFLVDGLRMHYLMSLLNAEAVRDHSGLDIVQGWAIYDLIEDVTGAAFVAERYWWNTTADGTWVDFTPRPEHLQQLLLVEAFTPCPAAQAVPLTAEHEALAGRLLGLRFPKARRAGRRGVILKAKVPPLGGGDGALSSTAPARSPGETLAQTQEPACKEPTSLLEPAAEATGSRSTAAASPTSPQGTSMSASVEMPRTASPSAEMAPAARRPFPSAVRVMDGEEAKSLVKRVRQGDHTALDEALQRVEASTEICDRLVMAGICAAIPGQLRNSSSALAALRLLALVSRLSLTIAAPGGGLYRQVAETFVKADGIQPLVYLASAEVEAASLAAEALGHICFRSPFTQAKAAKAGAIRSIVLLLGQRKGGIQEASYALWHLQVGQKDHAQMAFQDGAAAVLLPLFTAGAPSSSPEVTVNVLGAVTSLLMAEGSQDALGAHGAVEALCDYISSDQPLRVRQQAAAALANLLSGHGENCRKALRTSTLESLLQLLQLPEGGHSASSASAAEHASAVLANLVSNVPMAAQQAADAGAVEALASQLQSSIRPGQVFAALANFSAKLPKLCPQLAALVPEHRLVEAMKPGDTNDAPRARLAAVALSANLALHGPAKLRLLKAGILKPLTVIIESPADKATRDNAATALANLLEGHQEALAKVFMEMPDLPRRIVYILKSNKNLLPSTRQQLTRAAALFASREASRVAVKESGAPEAFTEMLDDPEVARDAAMGLLNLAPVAKDRDKILVKGSVKKLVSLLKEPDAKAYAAGALANLTAGSKNASSQAASEGAVPLLAEILIEIGNAKSPAEDRDCAAWALGALSHILEFADIEAVRQQAGPALPAMCEHLVEGHGYVQDLAIFALGTLVATAAQQLRKTFRTNAATAATLRKAYEELPGGPLKDRAMKLLRLAN